MSGDFPAQNPAMAEITWTPIKLCKITAAFTNRLVVQEQRFRPGCWVLIMDPEAVPWIGSLGP